LKNCVSQKRRGLSSIVGALLFVVLMVATFAVLGVALDSQTDIVDTSRMVTDTGLKKQQERFAINSIIQTSGDNLEINVTNTGQNPTEIFTLVMTNSSDLTNNYPTKTIDIPSDTSFIPPNSNNPTNIVKTLNLKLNDNPQKELYQFKVISSLGTIEKLFVECQNGNCGLGESGGGPSGLFAQFLMDGPNGVNTKNSTAVMFVTNTGQVKLTDVAPVTPCDNMWTVQPSTTGRDFNSCQLKPLSISTLEVGQTAIFKWDGQIIGEIDDEFQFCNQARGFDPDSLAVTSPGLECDELTVIDPNDCGDCGPGGEDDPLDDRFITRPELFLIIPSPFGNPGSGPGGPDPPIGRALWGANVVNPTDTTMFIHKITITAFAPASNDNIDVFKTAPSDELACNPQDISPGNGTVPWGGPANQRPEGEAGFWSCPGSNTLMWKNYANPITLPPQSSFPFLAKLESSINEPNTVESVLVDSTVFTTSGSFGKGNYQTTYFTDGMYANVYGTSDWEDPLNIDKISNSRLNIPSGSEETFHIALSEFDYNVNTFINDTSKIVINVPRDFINVEIIEDETFGVIEITNVEPSVVVHPDNTSQIIATLSPSTRVGDTATPEAVVVTFNATAPIVTQDKLMVMYTLANGEGTGNSSVGPLAEIILHVLPP
jgi:hypothetical protein